MDVAGKVGKGGMGVKRRGSCMCVQRSWMGRGLRESGRINRSHEELIDGGAASQGSGAQQAGKSHRQGRETRERKINPGRKTEKVLLSSED